MFTSWFKINWWIKINIQNIIKPGNENHLHSDDDGKPWSEYIMMMMMAMTKKQNDDDDDDLNDVVMAWI